MPIIKARPESQKTKVRVIAHLTKENSDTLQAYAGFIGEANDIDYVLNQLVESVLARDKDFIATRRGTDGLGKTRAAKPA